MINPLLEKFTTPFETAPFHLIKTDHFLPAIEEAIQMAQSDIESIKQHAIPDFENTIAALDQAGEKLNIVSSIFFNLNAAETNETIQKLAREISPLLTAHSNNILLDPELFDRISKVHSQQENIKLTEEQKTLLEKTYKSFIRNGANLNAEQKDMLRQIDQELSQLGLKFGENVLAETNNYELIIKKEEELSGLPDDAKEAAGQVAEEKGHPGTWIITLAYPSYIPFMTYADNRNLRKQLFIAYNTKANKDDALDNKLFIKEMLRLKKERVSLLGYSSYSDFVLEERMAKSGPAVMNFLTQLLEKASPKAKEDVSELEAFAKKLDNPERLEKWDFSYYAEKLKKQKYEVDNEQLRPFFKLENVIEGVFTTAGKLFGLQFQENNAIPVYSPEVTAYEVKNLEGKHIAVFYADFFPRPGKRNGAWMTSYRGQKIKNGINQRPHVSIVCNFTKPTKTKPSLLNFNEVTTLFHEFGHALHGMLANGNYEALSGTSVYWDFVELPSQIFENWCYEKECLDLFARHYETGVAIPAELIHKIKLASNFHQGYQTLRQISLGLLDMAYHSTDPQEIVDIQAFEKQIMKETNLLPDVPGTLISTSFSHIFQGGYAAGYYSYKWAEVLDADAFEQFQENGIFDQKTADSFKINILAAGGTEHPSILYKRFRGREPKPDALLKRSGLI